MAWIESLIDFLKKLSVRPPEPLQAPLPAEGPKPVPEPIKPSVAVVVPLTPPQRIYRVAYDSLGKHMGLDITVPKELNCANALTHVLIKAGIKGLPTKGIAGTTRLYEWLRANKSFVQVKTPDVGDVVIYPSGFGKLEHGHVFIKGKVQMLSNNSKNGLWSNHWKNLAEADAYYTDRGGIPRYSFRWKG